MTPIRRLALPGLAPLAAQADRTFNVKLQDGAGRRLQCGIVELAPQ